MKKQIIPEPSIQPHVVILGAGASRAALPKGDKNGRAVPVMNDLKKILNLDDILRKFNVSIDSENFEILYSRLKETPSTAECALAIETAVFNYFSKFELPDNPTIYDHLVLSLRSKDLIATFNWDPFLVQAMRRCSQYVPSLPMNHFLHGNVSIGYCLTCEPKGIGLRGSSCLTCGKPLSNSKLLFPIVQKNYQSDPQLCGVWDSVLNYFKNAYIITIFGYGAPSSDFEAIRLFKSAWGDANDHGQEEFEMINIEKREHLLASWSQFICREHYRICNQFGHSMLAQHPRRTCEALFDAMGMLSPRQKNMIWPSRSWKKIIGFYKSLYSEEQSGGPV